MTSDFWIIRPFNTVFLLVFAAFLLLLIVASLILRNKSERTKETVLVCACLVTFVGFFVYKYFLSIDQSYNIVAASVGGFNWWGELPLHLCNINMILIPIGVLRKSRPLMNFSFFLGPLGAMMALAMPTVGFSGYSLLLPRMLGFYGTHFMIVIEGLALVTFGLFRPVLRDLPKTILSALGIAFLVFLFSMLLRWTGLNPNANYFFSVDTEGNPILELFHSWLPYPFLYLIPCTGILAVYMGLVMLLFTVTDKRKR